MIDRDYFMATMSFLSNIICELDLETVDADEVEFQDNILGLCGAVITLFSWVFRVPEDIFYSYVGFTGSDCGNYFDFLQNEIFLGSEHAERIITRFDSPEQAKGLKSPGDLYDYLVGGTKKNKLS